MRALFTFALSVGVVGSVACGDDSPPSLRTGRHAVTAITAEETCTRQPPDDPDEAFWTLYSASHGWSLDTAEYGLDGDGRDGEKYLFERTTGSQITGCDITILVQLEPTDDGFSGVMTTTLDMCDGSDCRWRHEVEGTKVADRQTEIDE